MTRLALRRPVVVLTALAWLACGGSGRSPQSPDSLTTRAPDGLPVGAELVLVSGENGSPVSDAQVTLAGATYSADGGGRVVISRAASYGSLLDVVAPGFFDRQTILRRGGPTRFVLWPRRTQSGIDEAYTEQIVYTAATLTSGSGPFGQDPLRRTATGETRATVVLTDEIRLDDHAQEAHADAIADLNTWLAGRLHYSLSAVPPSSGLVFAARVDPADEDCRAGRVRAYFRGRMNGRGEIAGGDVVYCSLDIAGTKTVIHELGHSLGLQHVYTYLNDVMSPRYRYDRRSQFSDREGLIMNLLFERPAGNRYPDSDRGASGASRGTFTILCP